MKITALHQRTLDAITAAGKAGITINVLAIRVCMSPNGPRGHVQKLLRESLIWSATSPLIASNRCPVHYFASREWRDDWLKAQLRAPDQLSPTVLSYHQLPRFTSPAPGRLVESSVKFRLPTDNQPPIRKGGEDFRKFCSIG